MGLRRFQIELPREWQDRTPYSFESPAVEGRTTQLVLESVAADGATLAEFAATRMAKTRAALPDAELLTQQPVALGEGRPAVRFLYRQQAAGASTYVAETIVAFQGRYLAFSATFDDQTRAVHGPAVERIVASLAPAPAVG